MDQKTIKTLFSLLSYGISKRKMTSEEIDCFSLESLRCLLEISAKHDLAHLLVLGLKENNLIDVKEYKGIEKHILMAVYRYERIRYEYENLCEALEKEKISFLPLKGTVIRKYYLEEWMRTSCDIDILVRKEDVEKAQSILVEQYGYIYDGKSSHDVSLFSPSDVHVELHYDLVEDGLANEASIILRQVWDLVSTKEGFDYLYEMPDELYYFYHIAHMAKHFENGGCGIRPFIDLWILDNLNGVDNSKRMELLSKAKLLKFTEAVQKLSRIWFSGEEYDLISRQMEHYILKGGVYGNSENHVIIQQQKRGGRTKYILSRIFLPYEEIKYYYPILQKHRWLTPFMEVVRWCKLLSGGRFKQAKKELEYNNNISAEQAANMRVFLNNIGL